MKKIVSMICLIAFINAFIPAFAATKVPAGTTIPISINQKITSKSVASGASIKAKIEEDVMVNNELVFKKGDSASINVMSAEKAGFIGKPGELVLYGGKVYDVNGKPHSHEFSRQINGTEKTWPKVCLGVSIFFLWPLALFGFVKGGQAEINPLPPIEVVIPNEFTLE
jgi:hypothetical protein